jgi:hypothetical protein
MLISSTNYSDIVKSIAEHVNGNAALISIAEHTEVDVSKLIQKLGQKKVRFMGGIFPRVIHDNQIFEKGIVINTLNHLESVNVIKNISKGQLKIPDFHFAEDQEYSLLTYVDGLTANISNYLENLYEKYGMQTTYFGGGAGSLSLKQGPCVFTNDGLFEDAAVYCILKIRTKIGVSHGWKKVDGPFIVTKAEGNIIKEINWKKPFETYKEVVEKHSQQKFTPDNFFDIAKAYPFGILKDSSEHIVRDPLSVNEEGELVCVGELENNMLIDILDGNTGSLIKAAKNASKDAVGQTNSPKKAIIIDCISRILFLEDQFQVELDQITDAIKNNFPNLSIGGALTLGEISSYGDGFLEFYNKTVVIGLFEYED